MRHKHFEKHQLIANFLAKFQNAYEALNIGNKNDSHDFISKRLDLTKSSFAMLRSEYDGFYNLRKGLPEPYKRKTRVEYKIKYDDYDFYAYLNLVKKILENPESEISQKP